MRLENIAARAGNFLKNGGLNLREKANIYGGALLGFLGPILATKYLFFGSEPGENPQVEAIKWVSSLVVAPYLAIGIPVGVSFGVRSAKALKQTRQEREKYNPQA